MPSSYAVRQLRFRTESDISYSINYEKLQCWLPVLIQNYSGIELECNDKDLDFEEI